MPPIVSIVGKSESGKTTLLEKLITELKSRGYRVATVKHAPNESSFDEPGKDSWRHVRAGSARAFGEQGEAEDEPAARSSGTEKKRAPTQIQDLCHPVSSRPPWPVRP